MAGTVFKRGRFWHVDARRIGGTKFSTGSTKKKDAELVLARLRLEFEARSGPVDPEAGEETLDFAISTWLSHAGDKASIHGDEQRLKDRIVPFFGVGRRLRDIKPKDIDQLRQWLEQQPLQRDQVGTLAPATVNRHLDVLRAVLNMAVTMEWLDRNPCKGMRRCKEPEGRDRICTPDEYQRLKRSNPPPDTSLATTLGYELGLRRGEVFNLEHEDIDLKARTLVVTKSKTGDRRVVPLSDAAIEALLAHPGERRGRVTSTSVESFSHRWQNLCRRADVKGLTFHDLRHTAATRMRRAGVDLVTIKKIFGWRSWTTVERYQTVDHGDLLAAMDAREAHES